MDYRFLQIDFKTALSALADLVMPRVCVVCGRTLLPQERHLCLLCRSDLPLTRYEHMRDNPMSTSLNALVQRRIDEMDVATGSAAPEPFSYAAALYYYSGASGYRLISQALKYRRNFAVGCHFADMLGARLASSTLFADVDLVVPVPLHPSRHRRRGYNQAGIIAGRVALQLDSRCAPHLLSRIRRTRSQAHLTGEAKGSNVAGAFRSGPIPNGTRHILLIDDVYTTGATMAACIAALRSAEAQPSVPLRISVATLAFVDR